MFFSNAYIDNVMILNLLHSNANELGDLIHGSFFIYAVFFILLPLFLLYKVEVVAQPFFTRIKSILKILALCISMILLGVVVESKHYASFFRQHKYVRYFINPIGWVYATDKYFKKNVMAKSSEFIKIAEDAVINNHDGKRKIVILVVGETVRGDHISLNGYGRETFGLMAKEDVISFPQFTSCGTSTAISVPCMFSASSRTDFDIANAKNTENLLDVLHKTGQIHVLWRDNNSDSKGVAARVKFEDYKSANTNKVCTKDECRDVGMLEGIEELVNNSDNAQKSILIVLHQMGNHGPAYYKRYPDEFEKFKPACLTSELQKCSQQDIINTYDNALVYTDYFLKETLEVLKKFPNDDTALIYVSDHGESLGENGVYLHGMPYMFAPEAQTNAAMILWFGGELRPKVDMEKLSTKVKDQLSHDNLYHSILGLFNVETSTYVPELDVLKDAIKQ